MGGIGMNRKELLKERDEAAQKLRNLLGTMNYFAGQNAESGFMSGSIWMLSRLEQELSAERERAKTQQEEAVKGLVEALRSLMNESQGALGVGEWEFRAILGNTNYECYLSRVKEAKQVLESYNKCQQPDLESSNEKINKLAIENMQRTHKPVEGRCYFCKRDCFVCMHKFCSECSCWKYCWMD